MSSDHETAHARWQSLYRALLEAIDIISRVDDTRDGSREKALAHLAPFFAQGAHSGTPTRSLPQYRLSDAVRAEGYELVADSEGLARIGDDSSFVTVCKGNKLLAASDSWDWAYSAAHEIAEHRHGFEHSEKMWSEQANLMAKWIKRLGAT